MFVILQAPQVVVCAIRLLCAKKGGDPNCFECSPFVGSYVYSSLSTEAKLLHDSSVSLNVNCLEIIKYTTTLTNKLKKRTTGYIVVLVALKVLSKVSDTVGKQCYLALWRTCISVRLSVLLEKLLFLFGHKVFCHSFKKIKG